MKTVAIIQARLGSTRLPGKILADICGQTMIEHVVSRVECAKRIDEVVIATTDQETDQLFVDFCNEKQWNVFRGSENDVLSRYVGAARQFGADRIVRVTSDCPLIDPGLIDELISILSMVQGIDYACNFYPKRRYPRGLDCEALTFDALQRIDAEAQLPEFREHVTLYAYRKSGSFSIGSTTCANDHSDLRWTVDTAEDLDLIRQIYSHFYEIGKTDFDWKQVVSAYHLRPDWRGINHEVLQKVA